VNLSCGGGLACALLRDGPSFGLILWVLTLSVAAFAVATVLSWRPAWFKAFAAGKKNPAWRAREEA